MHYLDQIFVVRGRLDADCSHFWVIACRSQSHLRLLRLQSGVKVELSPFCGFDVGLADSMLDDQWTQICITKQIYMEITRTKISTPEPYLVNMEITESKFWYCKYASKDHWIQIISFAEIYANHCTPFLYYVRIYMETTFELRVITSDIYRDHYTQFSSSRCIKDMEISKMSKLITQRIYCLRITEDSGLLLQLIYARLAKIFAKLLRPHIFGDRWTRRVWEDSRYLI